MIIEVLLLVIGLVILIVSANGLVEGASSIATKFGVSAFTVGLTVVAFGTSLPELVVNIMASIKGSSGIAFGNVLGSNTINILLVVGIAAIIKPVNVKTSTVKIEIPFSFLAIIVLFFLANDSIIDGAPISLLSMIDGLILFSFLVVFLYYTFLSSKTEKSDSVNDVKIRKTWISVIFVFAGIFGLYLGGKFVVDSAIIIAQSIGVSDKLIGLTVIAIGTSLPELVTSGVAAYKGNSDIAIGNILGSNIFNIFMVLGVSSIILPLPFDISSNIDILVTGIATIMLVLFALVGPDQKIDRKEGFLFVLVYLGYVVYLVIKG